MKSVEFHETEAVFQMNRKSANGFGTYRPAAIPIQFRVIFLTHLYLR